MEDRNTSSTTTVLPAHNGTPVSENSGNGGAAAENGAASKTTLKLADLIDVPRLQELMDVFYGVSNIPTAILDTDGTVLTATAWQEICTQFHRACPACEQRCIQSDTSIGKRLGQGEHYVAYECANGLVDVGHPIIVNDKHIGTVFTGQFLYESPDIERFRRQAREFGFDEAAYLAALAKVPIVSRESVAPALDYLSQFTSMIADMGAERIRQIEAQAALEASEQHLRVFQELAENAPDAIAVTDLVGIVTFANPAFRELSGYGDEVIGQDIYQFYEQDNDYLRRVTSTARVEGFWRGVLTYRRKDGTAVQGHLSLFPIRGTDGEPFAMGRIVHDLSDQMRKDQEMLALKEQMIEAQRAALHELSSPLIPLSSEVVLMPLIGSVDSQRAQQIMETLLEGVARYKAGTAIVDITGVSVVDTQVANALIQAAQAVRLLGAQVILTGIGPTMAQTLVHLGADLSSIITRGSLQSAIAFAMNKMNTTKK
jgi:PAS domain S-box-containing protein